MKSFHSGVVFIFFTGAIAAFGRRMSYVPHRIPRVMMRGSQGSQSVEKTHMADVNQHMESSAGRSRFKGCGGPALVTAGNLEIYRKAAVALLGPADCVLEVGCQLGSTTALLASKAACVVGVDINKDMDGKGRVHTSVADAGLPDNIMFDIADPHDLLRIQKICNTHVENSPVTVLLVDAYDVIGNDLPLELLALCRQLSRVLAPSLHTILVRSKSLGQLQSQLSTARNIIGSEDLRPPRNGKPHIVAAFGVYEYRLAAEQLLQPGWRVLEIGCHFGTSTDLLHAATSKTGGSCVGVDISPDIIKSAKRKFPEVAFDVCDAWDILGLQRVVRRHLGRSHAAREDQIVDDEPVPDGPDMILLDVGGLSGAHGELDTLALVRMLTSTFSPTLQAIVVKSHNLRTLATQLRSGWRIAYGHDPAPSVPSVLDTLTY